MNHILIFICCTFCSFNTFSQVYPIIKNSLKNTEESICLHPPKNFSKILLRSLTGIPLNKIIPIIDPFDMATTLNLNSEIYLNQIKIVESYLADEKNVVSCQPLGGGKSTTLILTYANGHYGVFKPDRESFNRFEYEVASYEIAKHLGVKNVPSTTFLNLSSTNPALIGSCPELKTAFKLQNDVSLQSPPNPLKMVKGSVQLFVKEASTLESKDFSSLPETFRKRVFGMHYHFEHHYKSSETKILDFLINNCDRLGHQNMVFIKQGRQALSIEHQRPVLIDHSMAFLQADQLEEIKRIPRFNHYCSQLDEINKNPYMMTKKDRCKFAPTSKEMYQALKDLNPGHQLITYLKGITPKENQLFPFPLKNDLLDQLFARRNLLLDLYQECHF